MKKTLWILLALPMLAWGQSRFWDPTFHPFESLVLTNVEGIDPLEGFLVVAMLTNRESVNFYLSQANAFLRDFSARSQRSSQAEIAEALLRGLHERFMRRYRETANTVSGIFQTGEFNCVSSSILYAVMARRLGLSVRLNLYSTHARPEVLVGGQWIEVEATSPLGYDIRNREQVQRDFVRLTSFAVEPTPRAVITNLRQWYGMWYANEVYFAIKRRNISNAFQLALRAIHLESNLPFVKTNTVGAYQEFASFLLSRRLTNEALGVLEEGTALFPDNRVLSNNYQVMVHQIILGHLRGGRLIAGRQMIEQHTSLLSGNQDLLRSVYEELLHRLISTNAYQQSWDTLQEIAQKFGRERWFERVSLRGFSSLASRLTEEWKTYPEQEALVLQWYNSITSPERESHLLAYYNNIGLSYEQAGFSERALEIWKRGLEHLPNARHLRQNIAASYVNQANDTPSYRQKLHLYRQALQYDRDNWEIERVVLLVYRRVVEEYASKEDWNSVLTYAEEGLVRYPNDRQLLHFRDYARRQLRR